MNTSEKLAAEELKKAKAEAVKKLNSVGNTNRRGSFKSVKDFSRKDFQENKPYYIALLQIAPVVGAAHWFSAAKDVTEDGKKRFTARRNCTGNGVIVNDALVHGKCPDICPACYMAKYQAEYFDEHEELPKNVIPVDCYKGKPQGTQSLIYYYAVVGEPEEFWEVIKEHGKEISRKKAIKVKWWDEPCVLQIKPSISTKINEYLLKDEFGGDVTAYLWKFLKKDGTGFDKYEDCAPLIKDGSFVKTPEWIIEKRKAMISTLPTEKELIKPVSASEMADLLEIPDWESKKSGGTKKTAPTKEPAKEEERGSIDVGDDPSYDLGDPDSSGEVSDDTDLDLDLDLGSDEDLPF
jgi:hypothetical protein